jgi:hypothetical protein
VAPLDPPAEAAHPGGEVAGPTVRRRAGDGQRRLDVPAAVLEDLGQLHKGAVFPRELDEVAAPGGLELGDRAETAVEPGQEEQRPADAALRARQLQGPLGQGDGRPGSIVAEDVDRRAEQLVGVLGVAEGVVEAGEAGGR